MFIRSLLTKYKLNEKKKGFRAFEGCYLLLLSLEIEDLKVASIEFVLTL